MERRKITASELLDLVNNGARISKESEDEEGEKPTVIEGFSELIAKIDELADSYKKMLGAQREEMALLVSKVVELRSAGADINVTALQSALDKIAMNTQQEPRHTWTMNVERDGNGFISSVRANPDPVVKH